MEEKNERRNRKKQHLLVFSGKEKAKRLSVEEREMRFDSDDELHSTDTTVTSMKFKLPKKIFIDSSTYVPRKLRSAIRKRSCEASVSLLDGKRLNNRLKKSTICMHNGWSHHAPAGAVPTAISKDEEEVAETLFALAGMISRNGLNVNKMTDNESLKAKTSNFLNKLPRDPRPSSGGPLTLKEEPETFNPTPTTEGSPGACLRARALDNSTPHVWSKLSERRHMNSDLKVSVPPRQFQTPPLVRVCDDQQLTHSTFFYGLTEQNRDYRLNETKLEKYQLPTRETHINIGVADLAPSQEREHATSTECTDNALTSRPLHGSGVDGLPLQSSATIFPSWLNSSFSSKPGSSKDSPSTGKTPCSINGGRKSWRRCIAHVYISHLIRAVQLSEGIDKQPSDTSLLGESGQSLCRFVDPNGTLASGHLFGSEADKNSCLTANDEPILPINCRIEGEAHVLTGCSNSKRQSYNFLSLSTGAGPEVNNGVNRFGVALEAKGHVLELHSVAQRNTYLPSSLPQNCFPSILYGDQVAVAAAVAPSIPPRVQIPVPPYFSNRCGTVPVGTTNSSQQPHPKLQQQIWTDQLAHFRPGQILSSHVKNWTNSTWDPHPINHLKTHLLAPRVSPESIGSKYPQICQQPLKQLFGLCPSLPPSSVKLQSSQLPSICEDKGGRFHPDGVLPLQLLCNERLLS